MRSVFWSNFFEDLKRSSSIKNMYSINLYKQVINSDFSENQKRQYIIFIAVIKVYDHS